MRIEVTLDEVAQMPTRGTERSAGLDFYAREGALIPPGDTVLVGTGVHMAIPAGHVGLCFPRSGLSTKKGLTLANGVGVIDSDYRGEVMAPLHNLSHGARTVKAGERIFQMIVMRYPDVELEQVAELDETERGEGGFGSTGAM